MTDNSNGECKGINDEAIGTLSTAIDRLSKSIGQIPHQIKIESECDFGPLGDVLINIRNALTRIADALEINKQNGRNS